MKLLSGIKETFYRKIGVVPQEEVGALRGRLETLEYRIEAYKKALIASVEAREISVTVGDGTFISNGVVNGTLIILGDQTTVSGVCIEGDPGVSGMSLIAV